MKIQITENAEEMVEIGKRIVDEKSHIYNARTNSLIWKKINKMLPNATAEERSRIFYHSVYDYWAYGTNIDEEFSYGFLKCGGADNYKKRFITFRSRFLYTEYMNDVRDTHFLKNKYDAYQRFKDFYNREVITISGEDDYEKFENFVEKHPVFVAKPEDLGRCVGVHKEDSRGKDIRKIFEKLLREGIANNEEYAWGNTSSVVCEELIRQSSVMSALHPASVNCIRCTTVRIGDKMKIFYPWAKIGVGGEFVTGAAYGSLMAGVDLEKERICTAGYNESCEKYEKHPDTGIEFKGFPVPDTDDLVSKLELLSGLLPTVRYIGWDMVHTDDGWVVMEGNENGEFVAQIPYEKGMREEFEKLIDWKPKKDFWWQK